MNSAKIISRSMPATVIKNTVFNASITVKNTGDTEWVKNVYKFGSQNPTDNSVWGTHRIQLYKNILPNETVKIDFTLKSPNNIGRLDCSWRMVQELVEWFGDIASSSIEVIGVPVTYAVPWDITKISSLPFKKIIFNTGVVDITNGFHHTGVWENPFNDTIYITNSELWIGLALAGVADLHIELNRRSDNCEIQVYQNDRYSNPSLPNDQDEHHDPWFRLDADDAIKIICYGQRLIPNTMGNPEVAHFAARLKVTQ